MLKTIVTKGEYAKLKNREPSSVSNWIAEGKISRSALIGEGVRARIWVEQADCDLARSLDPSQQLAQENPILPDVVVLPEEQVGQGEQQLSPAAGTRSAKDADLLRRLKADADRAEEEAIAARRKNAVEEGRWIDAAEAARAWAGELARVIADTETFLSSTLARALADAHGLDWKLISTEIRGHFRKYRAEAADGSKAQREELERAQAEAAE